MFRRAFITLTMLVTFPALASAWYVNAKTSTTGQGTITPTGNTYYANGSASGEYTVAPAAGYSVSRVTLDGVAISPNGNGKYVAPYVSTKTWRYMVAYFAAAKFNITTSVTGSGAIREDTYESLTNIPAGAARQLLIIPSPGYQIDSVTADGATVTDNADGSKTAVYANIQANQSVSASFSLVPVFSVNAGRDLALEGTGTTFTANLVGEATSNQGAITYAWTSTPSGLVFATPNAASTLVYSNSANTYTATLTATSNGVSITDTATVTVLDGKAYYLNQCNSCHKAANTVQAGADYVAGKHYEASGHTTGTCQRCHATEGAIIAANVGWTGSYATLIANQAAIWTPNAPAGSANGISCSVCHDPHGQLRQVNTFDGTAVVAWNPNGNTGNDQFDVCTSCHTLLDNSGALVGNYHDGGSINTTRTISDSHYDNPATGVGLASNVVEGYVVRATSANPCADCHNLHTADLTIQEQWAASAHAGKIALKKEAAACTESVNWFNTTYPTNTAAACTDVKTVGTSTRTVLEFFQRNAAGIAFYKTVGALDDAEGNAWTHYNWDQTTSRGSCQRCHTATGIANFLNNPAAYNAAGTGNDFSHLSGWTASAGSPQQELLYCWGCHSDSQTGALRNPGAITEVYAAATTGAPTATVTYPNVGQSNVCMGCHLGREIGQNVVNDTDADGVRSFINSHYLTAGSTVFSQSGYEYAGQTYPAGFHQNVGQANVNGTGTAGPCVTCHMTGTETHTFEVVDPTGAPVSNQCINCHSTGLDAEAMATAKTTFEAALHELALALEAKGIYYYPAHPYFYTAAYVVGGTNTAFTNWAGVHGLSKWKDTMGAAFNYNVFHHDPGAYAHNRQYALKLIQDSIDFLADGSVNGAGVFTINSVATDLLKEAKEAPLAGNHIAFDQNDCATCHNSGLPGTEGAATTSPAAAHASVGQVEVSNVAVTSDATSVTMTFNVKLDGLNADNFTFTPAGYRYAASSPATVPGTYPIKNDFTRTSSVNPSSVVSNGDGNYTATWTLTPPTGSTTFMLNVFNAAASPRQEATVVGHLNGNPRDIASSTGCIDCHGNNAFKSGSHHGANPQGVEACVVCHTRATSVSRGAGGDRTTAYVHGIHNSHNMPGGGYDRTFPVPDPKVNDFSVTYPTYMQNCSVCHSTPAQLAAVNAAPVSYSLCMSCHDSWTGFGHALDGVTEDHTLFNWNTDCTSCHTQTAAEMHNGLTTERGGLIWNGLDVSVVEGEKTIATINDVSRSGNNLVVKWTATYDGAPTDPCFGPSTAADPRPSWKNGTGAFSLLRAWGEKDDWTNADIGTSPGQPVSTNLSFGTNTVCVGNEATTTIALTAAELAKPAGTKLGVALQGKPSIYNANISATTTVRGKSAIKAVSFADAAAEPVVLAANDRREVVDSASCLKCHVGSMYQHGGNRVDNIDFCVMCHNEASTEQNVRLLDGVSANEAYDGKPGMTYGFKSFLHAVHSAGENEAITMCYRTNGNYVWAGHASVIPNYPTLDVFSNPLESGMAALIYGSSAPHGTGPVVENIDGVDYKQVYRVHNVHHTTYPQALNNCLACHKPNTYGFPDPAKAVATTIDAGTVGLGGTIPAQNASNIINSNLADDIVQGPAAAACFSCHQGEMAAPASHGNVGGFAPANFGSRTNVPAETCASCHN